MTTYEASWSCERCRIHETGDMAAVDRAAERHTRDEKHTTRSGMRAVGK